MAAIQEIVSQIEQVNLALIEGCLRWWRSPGKTLIAKYLAYIISYLDFLKENISNILRTF